MTIVFITIIKTEFIVDAMSSFGAYDIPVKDWKIDYLVSSSNKCIQGVPGFAIIIANKDKLMNIKGIFPKK